SIPQVNAREALENTTISPSPRFFTSRPPVRSSAPRNSAKCSKRRPSAAAAPNLSASAVEPTRSVISTDTVSVAVGLIHPSSALQRVRAKWRSAAPFLEHLAERPLQGLRPSAWWTSATKSHPAAGAYAILGVVGFLPNACAGA